MYMNLYNMYQPLVYHMNPGDRSSWELMTPVQLFACESMPLVSDASPYVCLPNVRVLHLEALIYPSYIFPTKENIPCARFIRGIEIKEREKGK